MALKEDDAVWACGDNDYGQLGDGTNTRRTSPVQVSGLTGVTEISAGDIHGMAITDAAGNVTRTYQTDEFGEPIKASGSSSQPFGYTGEQVDARRYPREQDPVRHHPSLRTTVARGA